MTAVVPTEPATLPKMMLGSVLVNDHDWESEGLSPSPVGSRYRSPSLVAPPIDRDRSYRGECHPKQNVQEPPLDLRHRRIERCLHGRCGIRLNSLLLPGNRSHGCLHPAALIRVHTNQMVIYGLPRSLDRQHQHNLPTRPITLRPSTSDRRRFGAPLTFGSRRADLECSGSG